MLTRYVEYYERSRTHLALDKDAPASRPVSPARAGPIIAIPQVNGFIIATNATQRSQLQPHLWVRSTDLRTRAQLIAKQRPHSAATRFAGGVDQADPIRRRIILQKDGLFSRDRLTNHSGLRLAR